MPINSKSKGKVGELELAKVLRGHGIAARRGQQHAGGPQSPDVIADIPNCHIEVKRCERFNLYDAMKQAIRDAEGKRPIVCHRRNRQEWVAILRLGDLLDLLEAVGGIVLTN
jgi:Holliday junction resolvase